MYLHGRCVDIKLLENSKSFFIEFRGDTDVGNVGSIIVVKTIDVLHHTGIVCLDGCQNEKVLKVARGRRERERTHILYTYL